MELLCRFESLFLSQQFHECDFQSRPVDFDIEIEEMHLQRQRFVARAWGGVVKGWADSKIGDPFVLLAFVEDFNGIDTWWWQDLVLGT